MPNTTQQFAESLVKLYTEYSKALIQADKDGNGHYTEDDFNDLRNFIRFVANNYLS